jgi:hypothetical protein
MSGHSANGTIAGRTNDLEMMMVPKAGSILISLNMYQTMVVRQHKIRVNHRPTKETGMNALL